ncbi:DUF1801 domain-containing protein [Aestuariibius sp. HNIBRBA575]|uniref:DUF1801 domain-containing protein n=1 Tax=Aestuariibius sp. HNIBRBA575 TaxID=3233343 RepID=UPI0034A180CA
MILKGPEFQETRVWDVYATYPDPIRAPMLSLRAHIFDVAATLPQVGSIKETLKWGQPAYLTPETKSGSTLRLGLTKNGAIALFTHCQTTLISDFKALFLNDFTYDGNRALHLSEQQMTSLPLDQLSLLIKAALTYHLNPKQPPNGG